MAKPASKPTWEQAKRLFEYGNSLNEINEETGIDRASISKRAKKEQWEKGKFQHLIMDSVRVRTELSTLDVETRTGIEKIVEAKTRHIAFFENATTQNVSVMMAKIDEGTSILEHRHAQATIKEGREVVLGKYTETAIKLNTNVMIPTQLPIDPIEASREYQRIIRGE